MSGRQGNGATLRALLRFAEVTRGGRAAVFILQAKGRVNSHVDASRFSTSGKIRTPNAATRNDELKDLSSLSSSFRVQCSEFLSTRSPRRRRSPRRPQTRS